MKVAYLTQEFDVEPTRTVRVCPLQPSFPQSDAQYQRTRIVLTISYSYNLMLNIIGQGLCSQPHAPTMSCSIS